MPAPNILLMDGFDLYNGIGANTGLQAGWVLSANFYNPGLTTGRFGGQAFYFNNESACIYRTFSAASATATASCAFKMDNLFNANAASQQRTVVTLSSAQAPQVGWRHNSDGSISVYRMTSHTAGVLLGTSPSGMLKSATWHWIDFSVTMSATVGTIDLLIDGAVALHLTAQNTGSTTTIDGIFTGSQAGGVNTTGVNTYFDDVLVIDSITPLGERRIETIRPSADTATKQWTPDSGTVNFSRVNDAQVNSATFVSASVVGNTDLYDMIDLNSAPAVIDAVQVTVFAQKTDAGSRAIAIVGDIAGTQVVSSNLTLTSSINKLSSLLLTKPGGGAWDATSVNALRAGPKVTV